MVPESISSCTVNGSMCPREKAVNHSRSRQLLSTDSDGRCDCQQAETECICKWLKHEHNQFHELSYITKSFSIAKQIGKVATKENDGVL